MLTKTKPTSLTKGSSAEKVLLRWAMPLLNTDPITSRVIGADDEGQLESIAGYGYIVRIRGS